MHNWLCEFVDCLQGHSFARSVLNSVEQKAYVEYDTEKGGNYIWASALGASFGGMKERISIGNL